MAELSDQFPGVLEPPNLILTENFFLSDVDHSRFDKCGRCTGLGDDGTTKLEYDVYTELFELETRDKIQLVLLKQLSVTQELVNAFDHDQRVLGANVADAFSYVTYGVCYDRVVKDDVATLHISFGGLLMRLTTNARNVKDLNLDDRVYCMCRKE